MPTTQADVVALRTRSRDVVILAKEAFQAFFASLDLSDPVGSRDALLDFMPQLVATYGQAAATVAADWYETTRAGQVPGFYTATLAEVAPTEQVQRNVRYFAGHLFDGTADVFLAGMSGAMQKHIMNASRFTIQRNVLQDPEKPRYARVPQGKTCAWCTLLASRGFVYRSEATAGRFKHYHADCDCQAIADWSDHPALDGYDPDGLYQIYQDARRASGSTSDAGIAAEMRRQHPDLFTDGVVSSE